MKVYYTLINESIDIEKIDSLAKKMPIIRFKEYLKYRNDSDKIKNVVSYLLILKYLNDRNISIEPKIAITNLNKPYFANIDLHFNISHSDNMIVVAFSEDPVGVDVELIEDIIIKNSSIFSAQELEKYEEYLNCSKFKTKVWTIKESYTKMLGLGLNFAFSNISLDLTKDNIKYDDCFIDSFLIGNYYLSICGKEKERVIEEVSTNDLLSMF